MTNIYKKLRPWLVPISAILIIIVGTALLVAFAQGYTFDTTTGQIKSTGLVLINSNPGGASVYVNGKDFHKKTPYRYTNVSAGTINVLLKKPQYRDWLSTQNVTAGEVTFADNAFLLPTQLYQQSITQPVNYSQIIQSTDDKHNVALSADKKSIYSLNSDGEAKLIFDAKQNINISSIDGIIFSQNGDRIIFNQNLVNGQAEIVEQKLSESKTINLTTQLSITNPSDLRFNPADSNEIFWLQSGNLKKIKLSELTISQAIITGVASYSVSDDRLLVVQAPANPTDKSQQLSSYNLSAGDHKNIALIESDPAGFRMEFIKSRYNEYLTVIHNSDGQLELIKNPYSDQNQVISKEGVGVKYLSINPNSRFIIVNQDNVMRTIDLEFTEHYQFNTMISPSNTIKWLDNYHFIVQIDNQLRMIDYDGQNNQLLTPISDISSYSVNLDNKSVMPLNSQGQLFKLWLTKK